jgi:hypothetical protein
MAISLVSEHGLSAWFFQAPGWIKEQIKCILKGVTNENGKGLRKAVNFRWWSELL